MRVANSKTRTSGRGTVGSLAVLAAVFVVAVATSSTAATGARSSAFCPAAKTFFGHGTSLLTLPPQTIQADDAVFKSEQPKLLAAAPSSIKSDLQAIFTFDNGLFTDLSKVGWSVAKLPRSVLQSLAVSGPKLKPASDKVIGYLDSACGLKLPKP